MPDDAGFLGASLREPPSNLQAEQGLLGALLASNKALYAVADFLRPEHFADAANGKIFEVISDRIRSGVLADAVTLKLAFENSGILDEVGGVAYLARLLSAMVSVNTAPEYGRAVLDAWMRRELIQISQDSFNAAHGGGPDLDGAAAVQEAMGRLAELSGVGSQHRVVTWGDAARTAIAGFEAAYQGKTPAGLRSGFALVDNAFGPFLPGHFDILAGRPGMGKTALALQIAEGIGRTLLEQATNAPPFSGAGGHVLVFSQEMTAPELGTRGVSVATGYAGSDLEAGKVGRWDVIRNAQSYLDSLPILIEDTGGKTVQELISTAQSLSGRYNIRMWIVDHLQKMKLGKVASGQTGFAVAQVTSALKDTAKQMGVPILMLAQLGRDVDRRPDPRPRVDDLQYAGETDADVVALLWRPERYHPRTPPEHNGKESEEQFQKRKEAWERRKEELAGKAELIIAKHRSGAESVTVMEFDQKTTAFRTPGIQAPLDNDQGTWWEDQR